MGGGYVRKVPEEVKKNRSFSNSETVSWNQQEFTAIYDKYKLQGEKLINFIRYTAGLQGR